MINLNWKKKSKIYVPDETISHFHTHATRPIPIKICNKVLRIYFTSRTQEDKPLPTFIDVDINNPENILHINHELLMDFGQLGTFDDSGITATCIIPHKTWHWVYYVGWKIRRYNTTFEPSIGICKYTNDGKKFERLFEGPILAQDIHHPIFVAGPFVMQQNNIFKMWYCSGTDWILTANKPEPIYRIHYAESTDGINWQPHPKPAIDYQYHGEVLSAPWVVYCNQQYHMWYSTRGISKQNRFYKIGYASSSNGIDWVRQDHLVNIKCSATGWDSEMICYPAFIQHQQNIYMFYSGNDVGKGGIGYAITYNAQNALNN